MAPDTHGESTSTPGPVEESKGDTTRKNSLVQGELVNLDVMRKQGQDRRALHHRAHVCWDDFQYSLEIMRRNPRILTLSFIIFALLCGGGLGLVFFLAKDENDQDEALALNLAVETGRWFCTYCHSTFPRAIESSTNIHGVDAYLLLCDSC